VNTNVGDSSGLAINAEKDGKSFALIALRDGAYLRGFIAIRDGIVKPEELRPWAESTVKAK